MRDVHIPTAEITGEGITWKLTFYFYNEIDHTSPGNDNTSVCFPHVGNINRKKGHWVMLTRAANRQQTKHYFFVTPVLRFPYFSTAAGHSVPAALWKKDLKTKFTDLCGTKYGWPNPSVKQKPPLHLCAVVSKQNTGIHPTLNPPCANTCGYRMLPGAFRCKNLHSHLSLSQKDTHPQKAIKVVGSMIRNATKKTPLKQITNSRNA